MLPIWFSFHSVRPIEGVLGHFTRIAYMKVFGPFAILSYEERVGILELVSMERRLTFVHLCLCFKIVHGLCGIFGEFFEFLLLCTLREGTS